MNDGHRLVIAMDYDETYTSDPKLWQSLIEAATNRGHTVYIVTARSRQELLGMADTGCLVVATGRSAKGPFMLGEGIEVDIWIDDDPVHILADHRGVR